jgi:hypothetical protein
MVFLSPMFLQSYSCDAFAKWHLTKHKWWSIIQSVQRDDNFIFIDLAIGPARSESCSVADPRSFAPHEFWGFDFFWFQFPEKSISDRMKISATSWATAGRSHAGQLWNRPTPVWLLCSRWGRLHRSTVSDSLSRRRYDSSITHIPRTGLDHAIPSPTRHWVHDSIRSAVQLETSRMSRHGKTNLGAFGQKWQNLTTCPKDGRDHNVLAQVAKGTARV